MIFFNMIVEVFLLIKDCTFLKREKINLDEEEMANGDHKVQTKRDEG